MPRTSQELRIFPENASPAEFLDAMKQHRSDTWHYTGEGARQTPRESLSWEPSRYYSTREGPEHSMLFVFVIAEDDHLTVSNIVSFVRDHLSFDEYNRVLQSFCRDVVEPVTRHMPARIELTDEVVSLEDLLPPNVFHKLKQFAGTVNKGTSGLHPASNT